MDCNAYSVLVDLSFQALGLGGLDQLTAGLSVFNPLCFEGLNTLTIKLDGGYPMTLTEDSCAVSAKNLAVGMKIRLSIAWTNWVTITAISDVPPSIVRIDYVDSSGREDFFFSGNEARQQVLSSTQIPA
nr:hypothetical protein [uncultured Mediterranean phage uvMED]|tara:strand:+ start:5371 stop:5757 length:387 start_codon:yes stop_codon:yes gene_type:complete